MFISPSPAMAVKLKLNLPAGVPSGKPAPPAITLFYVVVMQSHITCNLCTTGKATSVNTVTVYF